jgi:uncharacterized protein
MDTSLIEKKCRVFETSQWVPRSLEEVFSFFSDAKNLEVITPPWVQFRILNMSTPQIEQGTLLDYRIKVKGVPMKWRTRIENWNPPHGFVDTQLIGPYSIWHHTHSFAEKNGGTEMKDRVLYRVPLGRAGDLLLGWQIRKDVEAIFAYRQKTIDEMFGKPT